MGGSDKTISKCIFDLVNTSKPSGGLVGPGNSLWFHKLALKIFGTIGPDYKKLIMNHACIHDACGFLMNHFKVRPGYVYGLFEENTLEISNAGKTRGYFDSTFSSLRCLGQLTGLCRYQFDWLPSPRADPRATNFSFKIPALGTAFQCKTPAPGSKKTKQNPHPGHNLPTQMPRYQ